ncbi:MAG: hypothetical protein KDC34_01380 [Saprospiraceae bacterium]|nr:hypothetical protein [Saprospiraceae bacterium]
MRNFIVILIGLGSLLLLAKCTQTQKGVSVNISEAPFERLSQYHFFVGDPSALQPNTGVLPYDLNTPLFSDYAHKARFVWLPPGTSAAYTTDHVLDFPVGAVLIKNFYFEKDERDPATERRLIETRLLVHRESGWEAHSYIWNARQTDAELDIVGDIVAIDWTNTEGQAMHADYIIPNKNQCKGCHSYKQKLEPIGPKVRNLNRSFAYADGTSNQLEKWAETGYLTGFDPAAQHPKAAVWNAPNEYPLHQRATAYLDINCGHCHNPFGPGGTTGLNLVYGAPIDLNLGVNKPPVATGRASGGRSYSIVKGAPDQSILLYRMESDETGVMMPELGRTMVHAEGISLIREWIQNME